MRRNLNGVMTSLVGSDLSKQVAMESLKMFVPKKYIEAVTLNAKVMNMPRVGSNENIITPAHQINLAPAVRQEECEDEGLPGMGGFGIGHTDKCDSRGSCTCMVANSWLPEEYEPRRFHLLGFGCYFVLESLFVMCFSGLWKHGGTPPIAPWGIEPADHAIHCMTVCYPPKAMISAAGTYIYPLASLPGRAQQDGLLMLGPEITSQMNSQRPPTSNYANWASDGIVIMERKSLFWLFVCLLLQLCAFLLGQLSRMLGAHIDSTTFLSAFSFIDNDGKQYSLGPWVGTEDGIVVDIPCKDSSTWGVDVPSCVYDDTPFSAEADPNGTEQSTTLPCKPSTSSLHPITEISTLNSQILDEQVEHKRHGRWNRWFDHLEDQSRFIPSQL
ncbi:uncharacterized protein LACBIDRAFT_312119 [Laccaria bicolor S238N-H82]|uniref:Predicted protein n=1 Tax=Laccaria bicolor (strain S238N-H82 / ATCC MYA-4686) TaxID=486041 RepID=B0CZ45_LACBS|nr:uncharacterized protein LACBIDRAFT_312119 [Laccaria bicolor S238N-H82]EDR12557.1 predicted protein [Laccaria bicolor S238N-H82]|eukprot:XP_001876821.1 predicted protein [Laccaria bicolor S238N-H82]